jgi:hypothetical protein
VEGLSPAAAGRFLLYLYAQVVGLVSLTDVSPFMRRVVAEPGLELYRLGFAASVEECARVMLDGMLDNAG